MEAQEELTKAKNAAEVQQRLIDLMASCASDPLRFVQVAFPWGVGSLADQDGPDEWQIGILAAIRDGLSPEKAILMATASGHGIGKSALVAWIVLWSVATKPCTRGVVTANTENQLKTKTWAELAKWYNHCLVKSWFVLSATALYSADPAYERLWRVDQTTWSAANTEAFAGLHNQGGRILLIFDEASAIDDVIWEVSEGALTDANTEILWLCFGNPTKNTGRFRECFGRFRHRWQTRQIDSRTSRFSNKRQIQAWAEDYGEDSDFFKVRVRGQFPTSSANQFIPTQAIEACVQYEALDYQTLPIVMSVDVARYGDDRTVIGYRQGRYSTILGKYNGLDTVQTTEKVIKFIDEIDPDAVVVDGDGIGGAVVDQLKHRGYDKRNRRKLVYEFHGGATPEAPMTYYNKRAEVWGWLRDAIKDGMQLPKDHEVVTDLAQIEYEIENRRGRIMLEKKEDMKSRGLASPDIGDMLAMTFAVKIRGFRQVRTVEEEEFPGLVVPLAGWMG